MKQIYKAIIIDDEQKARTLLSQMLNEYTPQIQVLDLCVDLPNGVKSIRKFKPDLVFLDIEMPGHSGLELLDFFNEDEIDFNIIFTTAYSEFAIKAFKLSAIDYLLKPIDIEELKEAIKRFEKYQNSSLDRLQLLKENINPNISKKIAVPTAQTIHFLEIDQILYIKADSSYSEIFCIDGSKLLVSRTLKNFEEVLDMNQTFIRSHKSYIVNFHYITDYVKSDGGYIILDKKIEIPISADKSNELLEKIQLIKR